MSDQDQWKLFVKSFFSRRGGQQAQHCLTGIVRHIVEQGRRLSVRTLRTSLTKIIREYSGAPGVGNATEGSALRDMETSSGDDNFDDEQENIRTGAPIHYGEWGADDPSAEFLLYWEWVNERDWIALERMVRTDIEKAKGSSPTKRKAQKLSEILMEEFRNGRLALVPQEELARRIDTSPQNFSELKRKLFEMSPFFRMMLDPSRQRRGRDKKEMAYMETGHGNYES